MQTPHPSGYSKVHFFPLPDASRGFRIPKKRVIQSHKPDSTQLSVPPFEGSSSRNTQKSHTCSSSPPPTSFFRGQSSATCGKILSALWWSGRQAYAENVLFWIKVNKTELCSLELTTVFPSTLLTSRVLLPLRGCHRKGSWGRSSQDRVSFAHLLPSRCLLVVGCFWGALLLV